MYILLGKTYGNIAKTAVFVGTLGGLIAFLIIISDLAAPVLHEYGPDDSFFTSRPFVIICFVIFVVFPLSVVPDLESLTISSIVAVVTIVFVGVVVVVQSFAHDFISNLSSAHLGPKNEYSVFEAIPLILFAFAGILQVVSVMGEMPWREDGKTVTDMNICCRWTVVICASIYIIVGTKIAQLNSYHPLIRCFFRTTGAFGFVQFGDDTEGVILDDYDSDDIFANMGRLSMAIHVALAYPVILFPAQQSLLHSVIMPLYLHRTKRSGLAASLTSSSASHEGTNTAAMFEQSKIISVEADSNSNGGEESTRSVLHTSTADMEEQKDPAAHPSRSRAYSMEVLDAQEPPLPLRIASSLFITSLTALIAILLPQAEIVFG